ncbi:hypothetical protein SmJEL517_g03610 [Synchytrium microbalum]|uniref:Uncharacterized protein n=1 Tax=Synchytrium microbalum TaxID=1806994 RepID=A0A507C348_9FUNG|nr:uncharacterized protein SmJEL517_g03610 [Synchytrium microbalum]TPX33469.1 hypothetical protein SmJEL517_g03610 [Synchytrium microbalum]
MDKDTEMTSTDSLSLRPRKNASPERPKSFHGPNSQRPKSVQGSLQTIATPTIIPTLKIRDFAYPLSDPRHVGRPITKQGTINEQDEDHDHDDDDTDIDDTTPPPSANTNETGVDLHLILPALAKSLASASSPGLQFYRARGVFDFDRVTEWESSVKEGEELIVAYIPDSNNNSQGAATNTTTNIIVKTDPQESDFSEHVKQYVEYQSTYGDGWITGIRCQMLKNTQSATTTTSTTTQSATENISVIAKLMDCGLLPSSYIERL